MNHFLSLACAVSITAATASAQLTVNHEIIQSTSNFTWSGTSTLGNIVGNPSNQFQLAGNVLLDSAIAAGAAHYTSAAFVGGSAAVVPDLRGRINNPIPFLPPLATIEVNGLVLSPNSPSFPVTPTGAFGQFTANVTLTALAGTLIVTPLTGSPSSTNLAGSVSNATSASGFLSIGAGSLNLNLPISSTFMFSDPGTGASGTITVTGTLNANRIFAQRFCTGDGVATPCPCGNNAPATSGRGCLNSLGVGALLDPFGSARVSADTFRLDASGMPATATALYFQGTSESGAGAGVVFGDGLRCAAGTVIRLGTKTNVGGASSYPTGADQPISIRGGLPAVGANRTYQAWYRNAAAFCTASTFNLTGGLRVTWIP